MVPWESAELGLSAVSTFGFHLAPIDLDGRGPIEAIEHHAVLEAGLLEVTFERLVIAPLDLVGQEQRQKRSVIKLLSAGEDESLR